MLCTGHYWLLANDGNPVKNLNYKIIHQNSKLNISLRTLIQTSMCIRHLIAVNIQLLCCGIPEILLVLDRLTAGPFKWTGTGPRMKKIHVWHFWLMNCQDLVKICFKIKNILPNSSCRFSHLATEA